MCGMSRRHKLRNKEFFLWPNSPTPASLFRLRDHIHIHCTRQDSSGRGIGPSQRCGVKIPEENNIIKKTKVNKINMESTRNRRHLLHIHVKPYFTNLTESVYRVIQGRSGKISEQVTGRNLIGENKRPLYFFTSSSSTQCL
jgi:hypothetical protein